MNTNEILAKHGLVIVQANDVRKMMDYYQIADPTMKDAGNDEIYERLWNTLNEVGLAYGFHE